MESQLPIHIGCSRSSRCRRKSHSHFLERILGPCIRLFLFLHRLFHLLIFHRHQSRPVWYFRRCPKVHFLVSDLDIELFPYGGIPAPKWSTTHKISPSFHWRILFYSNGKISLRLARNLLSCIYQLGSEKHISISEQMGASAHIGNSSHGLCSGHSLWFLLLFCLCTSSQKILFLAHFRRFPIWWHVLPDRHVQRHLFPITFICTNFQNRMIYSNYQRTCHFVLHLTFQFYIWFL